MSVFGLLRYYQNILSNNRHIRINEEEVVISDNNKPYLTVSDSQIQLFNIDILSKLTTYGRDWDSFEAYRKFIQRLGNHLVKLNHLGFGYQVNNIDSELEQFRNHITAEFELVEEKSGDEADNRWFFIKHKTDRTVPKIELVLYLSHKYQEYCPQFQMDIDTDLSFNEIKLITDELLGKDFFFWQYDISRYGIVMAMGKIGQIDGIKILVGIGTNLRKPQIFAKT